MPITINGKTYYRTIEVCRIIGISRNTFFRWLREGLIGDVECVDRRGWRLFTGGDLERLKAEAHQVRPNTVKTRRAQGKFSDELTGELPTLPSQIKGVVRLGGK